MKKLILAALSLLFVLAPAYALEFSSNSMALCATDTAVFVASVTNDGNFQDSYTVSLSGDAAKWAVAAPAGFSLAQGGSEKVYIYVTPSIAALSGNYTIKATISSVGKTEEGTINIKVLDCHSVELLVASASQDICSATRADYSLQLKNTGKYTENFALSINGVPEKFSILSEDLVMLTAGQTKDILVYSTPPADQTGDFALTVTAASQNSKATASQQLQLKSRQCYDFNAKPDVNYLSFCEASEAKIPIAIENAGSVNNIYTLTADGPAWATVENAKVEVPAGQARFTNLVLFPSYGIAGDFSIKVTIAPDKGTKTEQMVIANVKTCNSADLKISETSDVICPNTEKAYAVSLVNTGQFDTRYSILVQGADFASSDKSFADLKAGESIDFNLIVAPKGVTTGKQTVKVLAEAQDASKATASYELSLDIASLESCFGVETTSALTSIDVAAGEPALVPIVVENKGVENSTYNLEVSGTGAAFVQLNPASLTLEGKSSKTVYAYVAVPEGTAKDSYKVTVAARLKDQASTMSTTSFDIVLSKEEVTTEKPTTSETPVSERFTSVKVKIVGWWTSFVEKVKSLFVKEAPAETETLEEQQPVANETEENITAPVIEEELAASEENLTVQEENITAPAENVTVPAENETVPAENITVTNETNETVPEITLTANETNETIPIAEEENQTAEGTNVTTPSENAQGLLSEALQAKLAEAKNETVQEESAKERFMSSFGSLSGGLATAMAFLTATTYFIPNWLFIVLVIVIVAFANYLLRRKDLVDKFNKFLDEDEPKPEEKKNGNGKKPTAQDILDAEKEDKKNGKKK